MAKKKFYVINLTPPPPKSDDPRGFIIDMNAVLDRSLPWQASFLYTKLVATMAHDLDTNELRITAKEVKALAESGQERAVRHLEMLAEVGYIRLTVEEF